jgi:RNA polymerase sigma-70 factor (ECF subfamily)
MKITNEVFEEVYSLFAKEIFSIVYGYIRNKDDAIDVVQNVFLKLLKLKKDFNTYADIKYLLIRMTINESLDMLKSSYHKLVVLDNDIVAASPQQISDNDLSKIAECVSLLPSKYKNVIILYYYNSMKIKDIATALKISESAVKKRLERARNIMKKKLEGSNQND